MGVNPLVTDLVPYLGLVIVSGELYPQVIGVVDGFWVVSDYNEVFALLRIVLRTREDGVICHRSATPCPLFQSSNPGLLENGLVKVVLIKLIAFVHRFESSLLVIVGHSLRCGP